MKEAIPILIVSHLAVAGGVYTLTDRRPVDTEVKHTGLFTIETTKILAATVESLRDENRLTVFTYKATATVEASRAWFWVFSGEQRLIVPAVVSYHLNLAALNQRDVKFDETSKVVTVKLPPLTLGEIAFQPEGATAINGGVLTYGDQTVEQLRKLNYLQARKAIVAQAQQPGLVSAAKQRAIANVQNYFEIPLRIAGRPDVKIVATFN